MALLFVGCGGTPPTPSAVSVSSPTSQPTATASIPPPCTNPEGGVCLNTVKAGTYTTVTFTPQLTYTVPDDWQNLEDTPGNFLLVAPGYSLEGVNVGGSDYIGVYTSVKAQNRECDTEEEAGSDQPDVAQTPEAMASEFQKRPGLVTSQAKPVTIGGLSGLVMDLRMAPDWKGTCFYSNGQPVVQLIGGVAPSGLDHGLGPGLSMRLYLLKRGDTTLAVEIDDFADGAHLDTYSKIVDKFTFGS
jgi:hypothetical protein